MWTADSGRQWTRCATIAFWKNYGLPEKLLGRSASSLAQPEARYEKPIDYRRRSGSAHGLLSEIVTGEVQRTLLGQPSGSAALGEASRVTVSGLSD